jgi:hypothetical protein
MQGARQMQKGEKEGCKLKEETDAEGRRGRMKIEGEGQGRCRREKTINRLWLFALWCGRRLQFRMLIRQLGLGLLSYCGIYTTGSVHRFKWSNRNRTELARFYGFKIGFLSWFGFLG